MQRYKAFVSECKNNGITPIEIGVPAGPNRINTILSELLSENDMPTAIACQEDGIAIPLMFQLARSGYNTPGDLSIIGFDDSFYAEETGLTTIRQDPIDMAAKAAEMTLSLISGKEIDNTHVIVPATLVVRASTSSLS